MSSGYDAIVVGARCGGSPTAMLLARNGYRVLLVDKATFPSDTMSTHLAHPPAVAALARWGILDQLEDTGCPPITMYSFDFGPVTIAGSPRPADGAANAYGPRGSCWTRCWSRPQPRRAQRCGSPSPSRRS
jgi:2-polyprenyl-6-methoxyphenol hydroxylase-like FAD-dependent oxidoreductase